MSDSRTAALRLWSRLISGDPLDAVERQRLADRLQQDAALREEIQADATLNALLRFMTDVRQTDDQFIQGVLDRCVAMPTPALSKADVHPPEPQVADPSRRSVPADCVPELAPSNGANISFTSRRHGKNQSGCRTRRGRRSRWTAFALTAFIFACLGLSLWSLREASIQIARTNPADSVSERVKTAEAQGQHSNQADAPRSIAAADHASDQQPDLLNPSPDDPDAETPPVARRTQQERIVEHSATESPEQFVTLTSINDPVWERRNVVGDRIGDEIVRLFAGSVELTFDQGAIVTVDGPIEFRPMSTGQLELRRGRLMASVPQEAIGFVVSTPTSNIVDLGTAFEVAVNDAGESSVQVLQGEIEVSPSARNEKNVQKWRLLPDEFHRASFFLLPEIQGLVPVSASLQGRGGQFRGFVTIDGKTAEFTSPEAFDNVRRRAATELLRSQENALRQWREFVDTMQRNMQGTMMLNGQEMQFGSLQDVIRWQHQMLENAQKAGNISSESGFSGSININGRVMTFRTREEYEAARRAAFGPAATFGIGDIPGMNPAPR